MGDYMTREELESLGDVTDAYVGLMFNGVLIPLAGYRNGQKVYDTYWIDL
jgi:hypothetical protein